MSKIALQGDASGTGTFTIAAPNSNSNPTLTLPTSSGTVVVTGGAQTIEFAAGTAAAPSITTTGDTNTGIYFPAADTIAFSEGGVESMRINSSGQVGIGTNNPTDRLTVSDGTTNVAVNPTGGVFYFGPTTNHPTVFITNNTERMRITNGGNVGIGTTSPSYILDIAGEGTGGANTLFMRWAAASSGYAPNLSLYKSRGTKASPTIVSDGDQTGAVVFGGYDGSNYQNTAYIESRVDAAPGANDMPGRLAFFTTPDGSTSATERMRITRQGAVLIGTTSEVNSTDAVNKIGNTTATAYARLMMQERSGNWISFCDGGTGHYGTISQSGAGVSYGSNSDYRLKENIAPMVGALEQVAKLKPCTYTWKSNGLAGQGFIAHELQEVIPDAVVGEKDATDMRDVLISESVPATFDDKGNQLTSEIPAIYEKREVPVHQTVDTSFLVATLTAAIQELKAITDAQATRIEALEAEVAALKGQ